jgi:glycosyltransferase involved in cell wall biosynthesis
MLKKTPRPADGDDKPLKLLYLSQYFHPEQFLNNHVAKALAKAGHKVEVVCCVPNYPNGRFFDGYSNRRRRIEEWEGVGIHRVFTIPRGHSALQLIANYLTYPIAASWNILRNRARRRSSVSFVSMPSPLFQALAGIFAKRAFGVPTIYWVQDMWPDSAIIALKLRNRFAVWALDRVCGWIYRQADLILVQSDGFHGKIAGFGVPPDRISTLPNSAPDFFAPVAEDDVPGRIRSLVPHGRRVLMFAGNIGESQDFDTIIAAAKLLPADSNLLIVVIGSGRDEERIKNKVAGEGLSSRFLFLGRHPEDDMPAFFSCADAMLVSLRSEPIFALTVPSKVQAYLACGKPILASLAGEGAKVIEASGTGFVVPPSSPQELGRAMDALTRTSDLELDGMGRRARKLYEESFSLEAVVTKLLLHIKAVA